MPRQFSDAELTEMRSSFAKHKAEPNVSVDEYVRARRIELGRSLDHRRPVYLDLRYWIILRDALLNRTADPTAKTLLDLLRRQVRAGRIFCPISGAVFLELLKQKDLSTRSATAQLIDDLSLGVTLAPEPERIGTELAHFLYSQRDQQALYPLQWLVWSKLSDVLDVVHPTDTGFQPQTELMIQKAFFDHMWGMSLA
jgi:hypothetical protein